MYIIRGISMREKEKERDTYTLRHTYRQRLIFMSMSVLYGISFPKTMDLNLYRLIANVA